MIKHTWTRTEIQDLIAKARTYVGTPFRHQGRGKNGLDCIGFLGVVANSFGAQINLPTDYGIDIDPVRFKNDLTRHLQEIPVSRAIFGDLLLIRFKGKSTHLALRTQDGIIHASNFYKKVTEHSYDETWKRSTIAAFRLPGRRVDE